MEGRKRKIRDMKALREKCIHDMKTPHAPNMPEARRLVVVHTAANRAMCATRDYRQVRGDLHSREEESLLTHNDDRLVQEHSHL